MKILVNAYGVFKAHRKLEPEQQSAFGRMAGLVEDGK
jgi:hypothetical protein